jgi:organic hydroperoxide reductase OsmC/OhrA
MSTHNALIDWSLQPDEDFLAGRYSRGHTVTFDRGVTLPASASPSVVRAPWSVDAAADPEEMFVAALASCHMLWFLDFAKHAGVLVRAYRDEPVGLMGKMAATGKIGVSQCTLRPRVDCDALPDVLEALHHQAHAACNIANSVLTQVVVEPVYDEAL